MLPFRTRAMASYAVVVLLLAGGMAFAIRRLQDLASGQISHVRVQENDITVVERLRWSGEAIVSAGRGYLLSGDPALLARLKWAEADFARSLQALKRHGLDSKGATLAAEVERCATEFTRRQKQFVANPHSGAVPSSLPRRFETELLPLQAELGRALDALVEHEERALEGFYEAGNRARARVSAWMYGLLGLLVLLSMGTSWFFARVLFRSYRQEREALATARQAVATRDELMGIVAHDLRNPLSTIALKATLLRRRGESEKARAEAESIERMTRRMEHLITSMLDSATLESGRLSMSPERLDVGALLKDAAEMFGNLATHRQLGLERREAVPPDLAVQVDRNRVLQVFSNLLGNAIKFTPDGGQVVIAADLQGESVRFGISDSGPGIAREHLPHLFDRFWKHETNGKKGTGLGLFIARGIVEGHGGRIWTESHPGHGATFWFTLPVAASA